MENLLLSVVIPIYNTIAQLPKCIESILNQSYSELQIILVDDGSTDGCADLCDEYASIDSRIEVLHKKNGGLVSARKAGARCVKGEYVISVDSDDWIEPDYFQKFVDAIALSNANQIWSISYYRDYNTISYLNHPIEYGEGLIESSEMQMCLYEKALGRYGYKDDVPYYMWSKCIEKKIFVSTYLSLNDRIDYQEDLAFSIRCIAADNNILFVDNPGYHYVQRDTSISHILSDKDIESLKIVRDDTLLFLSKFENFNYTQNIPKSAYLCAMIVKNFSELQYPDSKYLVPFQNVKKGSKIIIYGMGNVGKKISHFIKESKDYQLIACCDSRRLDGTITGCHFISVEEIKNYEYDYIIISTVKTCLIMEMKKKLLQANIPAEKVCYVPGLI